MSEKEFVRFRFFSRSQLFSDEVRIDVDLAVTTLITLSRIYSVHAF